MSSTIRTDALRLAELGFEVFPCKAKDKTPATKNGFKNATSDPAEIERLFKGRKNLAIATGLRSGVWVLDLDGSEGIEAFAEIEREFGTLPETVTAKTGGGGLHHFYTCDGAEIQNRSRLAGKPIDVRGDGGYVIAPPSIHPSGQAYEWQVSPYDRKPAVSPEWLLSFVREGLPSLIRTSKSKKERLPSLIRTLEIQSGDDLESDPGSTQGQRHSTALRLVGGAFARGLDLQTVTRQALAWAGRCQPPMSESEALKIVSDLQSKESAQEQQFENQPLPSSTWPSLHPDAFVGLAGEIVQAIEPSTEADPIALLVSLLVGFGSMIGRRSFFVVEGTRHYANEFAVLVGRTAKGRKGTSEGRIRSLFELVDPEWTKERIQSGLTSGEGLIWAVRDPIYETKPIKEKGRIVGSELVMTDTGVDDKRLLALESELASMLRAAKRETNTLSPTVRAAWDGSPLRILTKNSPATASESHISILGHITMEELIRALAAVEVFSGFANRFLWVAVRRSKILPDGGADLDISRFVEPLFQAVELAKDGGELKRSPEAAEIWRGIYYDLAGKHDGGLFGAVTSRSEAHILRLSMIFALLDRSLEIQAEHIRGANAVWQYASDSARMIFNSTGDSLADRVLAAIREEPGISRSGLHRKLKNHCKAEDLLRALAELRDAGVAHCKTMQTAGRPAETWVLSRGCELSKEGSKASSERSEQGEQSEITGGKEEFRL
jgi:hypothetical protein